MLLFLDCETSDLLKRFLPLDDPAQPWVVSIAAELSTLDGTAVGFLFSRIRSNGRKVRQGAVDVHGVTSRDADKWGCDEIPALGMLSGFAAQAQRCIGHGVDFDRQVIEGVLLRRKKDPRLLRRPGLHFIDTMTAATPFCRIEPTPPRDEGGFKWPSLDEASEILLQEPPRTGLHDAWADCQRVKRLYFTLEKLGAFEAAA